ncbi:hypothetical protein M0805_003271 [Coniferiporia weirii]|nr:hypothetical protein M0805_003271 [Coniferiporia weirii]
MVRAHVKQPVEEKKTVTKKRSANKKQKEQPSGVWPCKINGCNKVFAREADLKRHQRTTKLHMLPTSQPVLCPQCDATFTRTDALRRHQRSRHNGIIIDPIDLPNSNNADGDGEGSSASAPQSRSGSPSLSRGKRNRVMTSANTSISAPVQTVIARPDLSGPSSGSQSYYRQNTINPVFVPPRTPNGVLDPSSYQTTQIPTSAARFHAWVPNPPWIHENPNMPRPPGPITFVHPPPPGYYAPGTYYRAPNGQPAIPMHSLPHGVVTMQVNPDPPLQSVANPPPSATGDAAGVSSKPSVESNSNIDPSLENSSAVIKQPHETEGDDKGKEPDAVTFADTGLSVAVQKALRAVLAIDPSLNAAVAAVHAAVPQTASEKQDLTVLPPNASPSSTPSRTTVALSQGLPGQPPAADTSDSAGDKDRDTGMDVDADGEADLDGEGPFQEEWIFHVF